MYHLFACEHYYPSGGMGDYIDSFDTIEEARKKAETQYHDWYDIVIQREGDYINPAKLVLVERGTGEWLEASRFTIVWEQIESG